MWDMEPISVRLGSIGFYALNIILLSKLTELQINMDVSCPECGILVLKKNLNRHLLKHQDDKGEKCFLCDKDFKTKNSLKTIHSIFFGILTKGDQHFSIRDPTPEESENCAKECEEWCKVFPND